MDKQTYIIILLSGQLALMTLDLRERYLTGPDRFSQLRPGSILFVGGIILLYGALQLGGLALVPNLEEMLQLCHTFVDRLLRTAATGRDPGIWIVMAVGTAGFYFAGLCDYLFHRFVSHSQPLWFSHENHHLTTDVAAFMPGICVRPFAVLAVFPTTALSLFAVQLVLSVFGYHNWDMTPLVYVVTLVHMSILALTHSAFMRRCRWLPRLLTPLGITTPQEHWLHHTADLECNYGNSTILWDRVFGTYVDPAAIDRRQHRAGLGYDQDFLGTLTFGKFKLSNGVRRRFQIERFCYLQRELCGPDALSQVSGGIQCEQDLCPSLERTQPG